MTLTTYFRQQVYKWHRITGLLIVVPLLLWTLSGFLHPVMAMLKPNVPNQFLSVAIIDTSKLTVPLAAALEQNSINSLQNFRVVKLYKGFYYQVWQKNQDSLTYINCESGNVLRQGDKLYAGYLAQRYLFEENKNGPALGEHHHGRIQSPGELGLTGLASVPAPTQPLLKKSKIVSTTLLTSFEGDYKRSNKLLPVYEVAFDREDGLRLYIETRSDRLALAADDNKRWFTQFFALTHSWSFLDGTGKIKSVLLGAFSALCFVSCVLGFAVYNVLHKKSKRTTASKRWHRWMGNFFLVTTLFYAFSGAWHAFAKLPARPPSKPVKTVISASELRPGFSTVLASLPAGEKLLSLSVVRMNGNLYWQLSSRKGKTLHKQYRVVITGAVLEDGDHRYARYLSTKLKNAKESTVRSTTTLTAFNHRYTMMNKRLPVVEVEFADGERYFIETATGDLAAVSRPSVKAERFSFSNLHMHHYWEMWLGKETGKTVKNIFLISTTLGLLAVAVTGMLIYCRRKF